MLIQIHLLQNYAPSNLNRDDTGSPKDAFFGSFRRGRISSQCLKRSIRRSQVFKDAFERAGLLGARTKDLPGLIQKELEIMGIENEISQAVLARLPEFGRESGKSKEESEEASGEEAAEVETETKQLIFLAQNELRPLAEKLVEICRKMGTKAFSKAKIQDITKGMGSSVPRSVDVAMFGRMTTSYAFQDVEAAVQVAHALSTNALTQEFDYYTAVDDLTQESGAGMIGDIEYNSSTYYKYLNVHWQGLVKNLGGKESADVARQAVAALVEAAATAHPTGKQNSFAAFNLPDLVLVEVLTKNQPVSYANAFIKPARAGGERSLMDDSAAKLAEYMERVIGAYNLEGQRAFLALGDYKLPGSNPVHSLKDLQGWLKGLLDEAVEV